MRSIDVCTDGNRARARLHTVDVRNDERMFFFALQCVVLNSFGRLGVESQTYVGDAMCSARIPEIRARREKQKNHWKISSAHHAFRLMVEKNQIKMK